MPWLVVLHLLFIGYPIVGALAVLTPLPIVAYGKGRLWWAKRPLRAASHTS
jgi:hypothetical protein